MDSGFQDEAHLEEYLSRPSTHDVNAVRLHSGDFLILGAGGKMGPTLAMRIRRAIQLAGTSQKVIAVSRFSDPRATASLEAAGVHILSVDLMARDAMQQLPDAPNVIYLAGRKFGSSGDPSLTWAMNVLLPERVGERYRNSRIVALSSGNIYPLMPIESGGATEGDPVGPVGEYAQTVLGRERVFEYCSRQFGTKVVTIRLNYAVEPRYGVLADLAAKVHAGEAIDVTMPAVNIVWQGDANSIILRSFELCANLPRILNLTGPEIHRVRDLAQGFGKPVEFTGSEAPTALLNNSAFCWKHFGPPEHNVEQMLRWTYDWLDHGGRQLGKPTHFEARDGKF